jgi:RNA polymerase sigma-70 factor, ECF subfamily
MSNALCEPLAVPLPGQSYDDVVLPHLDAAYRLARWLLRNQHDAEDAVQEASLKALRYFRTFTGGNGRAWFLRIVRNTCSKRFSSRFQSSTDSFDEEHHSNFRPAADPETLLIHTADVTMIERAMSALPERFRELLVMRELEELSYRELADVLNIPIGTVMSRLSRSRRALREALVDEMTRGGGPQVARNISGVSQVSSDERVASFEEDHETHRGKTRVRNRRPVDVALGLP